MTAAEQIDREELAALLERNGYHTASADVAAGRDIREATAYIVLSDIRYNDGEARWLVSYLREIHS